MYLIMKIDSCYELRDIFKTDSKEQAEMFVEYMTKAQGLFGEYSYEIKPINEIKEIKVINNEQLENVRIEFDNKLKEYHKKL